MDYSNLENATFVIMATGCEYLKMLKDAKLAPVSFAISNLKLPNINQKIAAILHVTVHL